MSWLQFSSGPHYVKQNLKDEPRFKHWSEVCLWWGLVLASVCAVRTCQPHCTQRSHLQQELKTSSSHLSGMWSCVGIKVKYAHIIHFTISLETIASLARVATPDPLKYLIMVIVLWYQRLKKDPLNCCVFVNECRHVCWHIALISGLCPLT